MKNSKTFLIIMIVIITFLTGGVIVNAETQMECTYSGEFQGVDVTVGIKLEDNKFSIASQKWTDGSTVASSLQDFMPEGSEVTMHSDIYIAILNNSNKYKNVYIAGSAINPELYFVNGENWACPATLSFLHDRLENSATNINGLKLNYHMVITNSANALDSTTCDNSHITVAGTDHECGDDNQINLSLTDSKTTKYNGEKIEENNLSSGTCCLYKDKNNTRIYVYMYDNIAGADDYAACVGSNCFTGDPTNSNFASPLEKGTWDAYRNLSDCSKMPANLQFKLENGKYSFSPGSGTSGYTTANIQTDICKSTVYNPDDHSGVDEATKRSKKSTKPKKYDPTEITCNGILGKDLLEFLNEIFLYIKIAVPIILIVLGSVDFGKAVLIEDKEDLSKATSKFIKRCIIAVAIFFIPSILNYLLNAFNEWSKNNITTCDVGNIIIQFVKNSLFY